MLFFGTGPFGRCYVSNSGTARRYESPGASRSAMDREAKQLDPERTRSASHPSGGEGFRPKRYPVEVKRREPVRQRKQKGKQSLGEQRSGSGEYRAARREQTQTSVGACSESGKREAMNESLPVTYLWLLLRQGWFRERQKYSVPSITTRARFRLWLTACRPVKSLTVSDRLISATPLPWCENSWPLWVRFVAHFCFSDLWFPSQPFPAMGEFSAVPLSDSDGSEDLANQNTSNAVLDTVSNYHYGELLGECLSDKKLDDWLGLATSR